MQTYTFVRWTGAALIAGLSAFVGIGSLLSGVGIAELPYPLAVLRLRQPVAFPVHMVAGGLGLMLALAAIAGRRRARLHRAFGRIGAATLAIAALSAVPVAASSLASGTVRLALGAQAAACLACLAAGFLAARRRQWARHMRLMLSAAAIAFGAAVLRLLLIGAEIAALPHEPAYAMSAWIAWLVPLALVNTRAARRWLAL